MAGTPPERPGRGSGIPRDRAQPRRRGNHVSGIRVETFVLGTGHRSDRPRLGGGVGAVLERWFSPSSIPGPYYRYALPRLAPQRFGMGSSGERVLGTKKSPWFRAFEWQARQDSNLRPTVLETNNLRLSGAAYFRGALQSPYRRIFHRGRFASSWSWAEATAIYRSVVRELPWPK